MTKTATEQVSGATKSTTFTHAIPCLTYDDARAAIAFLVDVLGAEARHVYDGPNGTVAHAELWFGNGCIMLGSAREGMPARVTAIYIVTDNAATVDTLYERARNAGATISMALRDTDYGSHDFACRDPEGNTWNFGTYAPAP